MAQDRSEGRTAPFVGQAVAFQVLNSETKSTRTVKGDVVEVTDFYYRIIERVMKDGKPVEKRIKVFAPFPDTHPSGQTNLAGSP